MPQGWKHVLDDLSAALGLPARELSQKDTPAPSEASAPAGLPGSAALPAPAGAAEGDWPQAMTMAPLGGALVERATPIWAAEPEEAPQAQATPFRWVVGPDGQTPAEVPTYSGDIDNALTTAGEAQTITAEGDLADAALVPSEAPAPQPLSRTQKLVRYAGLGVAVLAAIAVGWYAYFGGPRPPAPNVVATFEGGQLTIQQVRDHLKLLAHGMEALHPASYATYRATIDHMVLNELVRRWAAEQNLDTSAKFADAMRHVTEAVTLDEWIAQLHESDLRAAVRESDIQAYYEANRALFGDATLSEVRDQIEETLAHQNQEQFFQDYLNELREMATIERFDERLDVSAPTEQEVLVYYDANSQQFSQPQQAIVDMVVVTPLTGDSTGDEQARAKAEAALAALNTGRAITEVIAEYSDRPFEAQGVVIQAGGGDSALAEQAFALSGAGDRSPVFRTEAGYTVLQLREQQPARVLALAEVRAQIEANLRVEKEARWFEQNANQTLFTIHGERFTLGQFYHEYQNLPAELQAQFAGPQGMRQLADLLIDRLLVLNDAYGKLLDQQNAPLLEETRLVILREMIHEAEVDSKVAVSDEAVRAYYDEHQELFVSPPEARIRTIRLYLGQTEDDQQRAWERAEAAYQALVPGMGDKARDFDTVAQEYDESEPDPSDPGLGEWVRMGDDVLRNLDAHPLHTYLLNLPVDAVSQPFVFGDSLYIVKILERTEPVPLAFDQVQEFIRAELEAREHERLDSELAGRLLREARLTVYDSTLRQMLEADQGTPAGQ